jgi:calcium-dependent protein kinase
MDLYSLGVTLYVLLCGFPPSFSTNDEDDVNVVIFLSTCDLLNDVKRLIRNMLNQDASRRITALEALQDVWIVRQTLSSPVCIPKKANHSFSIGPMTSRRHGTCPQ